MPISLNLSIQPAPTVVLDGCPVADGDNMGITVPAGTTRVIPLRYVQAAGSPAINLTNSNPAWTVTVDDPGSPAEGTPVSVNVHITAPADEADTGSTTGLTVPAE